MCVPSGTGAGVTGGARVLLLLLLPRIPLTKAVIWSISLFPGCRRGAGRQPQPERPDRAGGRDVVRSDPRPLHPHQPGHRTNGAARFSGGGVRLEVSCELNDTF